MHKTCLDQRIRNKQEERHDSNRRLKYVRKIAKLHEMFYKLHKHVFIDL